MIAIVSDFHMQATDLDALRYRTEQGICQTGVRRNIKAKALDRFFERIRENAVRQDSEEIHLVFAGDMFELHRAPHWFLGENNQVRPIDDLGADDEANPLRVTVDEIFDHLEHEHAAFWEDLQRQVARGVETLDGNTLPIQVHYLPGNHDRLANAWPSVRRRVRRLLAMPDVADDAAHPRPFPVKLDFTGPGGYGVRVRHGHEYDKHNFPTTVKKDQSLGLGWEEYLRPSFGDYITVDVATRLALAFRARYARELRRLQDGRSVGKRLRTLYLDLTEFDDVRPASLLPEYLSERVGADREQVFKYLRPVLRDVVEVAEQSGFLASEMRRLKIDARAYLRTFRDLIKFVPADILDRLVKLLTEAEERSSASGPANVAQWEAGLGSDVHIVVAGHTHRADQVPLDVAEHLEGCNYYLDTGTWRTTILHGIASFGRLRAYTMIFCYNDREREASQSDRRRFETWTGYMTSPEFGPYDEVAGKLPDGAEKPMQLRFTKITPVAVQRDLLGVQLELDYGVDDAGYQHRWVGVKKGEDLFFPAAKATVPLDPAMDGEVWCFGKELDPDFLGGWDDLLPWGLRRLPRDHAWKYEPGQPFVPRQGRITLKGLSDMHLVLHYVVEEAA